MNEYLRGRLGRRFSAKDFRTWGGTLRAATVLAELGAAAIPSRRRSETSRLAMRLVSAELGNTPTICRSVVRASDGHRAIHR